RGVDERPRAGGGGRDGLRQQRLWGLRPAPRKCTVGVQPRLGYSCLALDLGQPAFQSATGLQTRAGHLGNTPSCADQFKSIRLKERFAMAPTNGTIKRLVSDKGFGFILAS